MSVRSMLHELSKGDWLGRAIFAYTDRLILGGDMNWIEITTEDTSWPAYGVPIIALCRNGSVKMAIRKGMTESTALHVVTTTPPRDVVLHGITHWVYFEPPEPEEKPTLDMEMVMAFIDVTETRLGQIEDTLLGLVSHYHQYVHGLSPTEQTGPPKLLRPDELS